MNYLKIYNNLIEKRKKSAASGYTELHHIKPRSVGGSDEKVNLVRLTAREHFIAHLLLTKIYNKGTDHYKMVKSVSMMLCFGDNQIRYKPSLQYELLKKKFSEAQSSSQSGTNNSQYGTAWVFHEMFGAKRINKGLFEEYIQQGWFLGRSLRFVHRKMSRQEIKEKNKEKTLLKYPKLEEWYDIYSSKGFDELVKNTGYKYSKPNLVSLFSKYVPRFSPQNGKRRGC